MYFKSLRGSLTTNETVLESSYNIYTKLKEEISYIDEIMYFLSYVIAVDARIPKISQRGGGGRAKFVSLQCGFKMKT